MIPPEAVNLEYLSRLLDDAVIDWTVNGERTLYVTGLQPPLWVEHDAEAERVMFRTYWPVRRTTDDLVALRLANRCNANLVMVQFWFDAATRRFMGQYVLGCRDGIDRRLFIRSLRQFADIFAIAARDYDEDDALCERLDDPEGALD